jgi:multidrug resistance efflux pump
VEVDQISNIDPTISGTVYDLSVSVGDKVEKGQLLFMIDNDELGIDAEKAYSLYLQSKASLETAKANKKEAKENYDDASSSEKSIMKKKLETAEILLEVAGRNVQTSWDSYQNSLDDASEKKGGFDD